LGGVTMFLFASVAVSGVRWFTRLDRFMLAAALSFDVLVPDIFVHLFYGVNNANKGNANWPRCLLPLS